MPEGRNLPAGDIGGTTVYLAEWLDPGERYQRHYVPLDIRAEGIEGQERPVFSAQPGVRVWSIRSWSGGEGEDLWDPSLNAYRKADGIKPVNLGDGLELSRLVSATKDSGGSSDITDIHRLGYGVGKLWGVLDDTMYDWDLANDRWAAGTATGASGSDATSITDGDDNSNMYIGLEDKTIRKVADGGANSQHYATSTGDDFTYAPILRSFGGVLYALDGDDLYEIDTSTADTRTIRADIDGSSADYLGTTPWAYNRMSLSDKGPIWIQRLDSGQTFLWEYNVANDSQDRTGKLPVDFAFPYSIFYTRGFVFVGFRYANTHSEAGDAYIYFQRGAQRGVVGPFRASATASEPVLIAGVVGDDLIAVFDDKFWAYNMSDGGIHELGAFVTTGPAEDAITFGKEVFASGMSNKVDWAQDGSYVAAGDLYSGRFDFDYPGLQKELLEVTVVTDPLPAATSVTMEVAVDGGSDTALPVGSAETHDTDNETRYIFSTGTGSGMTGYEFELIPHMATTNSSNTPTIRQVNASVATAAWRYQWTLTIDVSDMSYEEIDNLNSLIGGGIVTFTDPWQNRETDTADSFSVRVQEVITPERKRPESSDQAVALLRILSRDLVTGTGGS